MSKIIYLEYYDMGVLFFGSYYLSHWKYTLKWKKYFCAYTEERNVEAHFALSINKRFAWVEILDPHEHLLKHLKQKVGFVSLYSEHR